MGSNGNFLTFHLAGGEMGMKHMLDQFGPALKLPWTKLKSPKLTKKLKEKSLKAQKTIKESFYKRFK